jgi:phage baseplate assembly protein V
MSRLVEVSRRVAMSASRGRVALVDAKKKCQQLQVELLADETKDNVEHFEPYGFTSHPKEGAEALVVFLGGGRDHGLVILAGDRRYRLTKLEEGDVALYTDEGTKLVLGRNRTITADCDTFNVTCKSLTLSASDSITVTSPSIDVNES